MRASVWKSSVPLFGSVSSYFALVVNERASSLGPNIEADRSDDATRVSFNLFTVASWPLGRCFLSPEGR